MIILIEIDTINIYTPKQMNLHLPFLKIVLIRSHIRTMQFIIKYVQRNVTSMNKDEMLFEPIAQVQIQWKKIG